MGACTHAEILNLSIKGSSFEVVPCSGAALETGSSPFPSSCNLFGMVYVVLNGGSDLPFPRTLQSLPLLMIPSLTLYQDLSAIEQGTGGKKGRNPILPWALGTLSSSTAEKNTLKVKSCHCSPLAYCLSLHTARDAGP